MVNVVDVDISLNNFQKAFGRNPTADETALMMRLKALRQEKQKAVSNTSNLMERSKKMQEIAKQRSTAKLSNEVRCTPRGIQINKMLNYGLNREQIMDVLNLDAEKVDNAIERFRLPRPIEDLVYHEKLRN